MSKDSAAAFQGLVETYRNAGMGAVMNEYLGGQPVLLAERLQIDRQIITFGLPWHQDGGFFGGDMGGVNSVLALDDVDADITGLSVGTRRIDEMTMHRTATPSDTPKARFWAITWFFAPSRFPAQRHPLWFS